MGGREGVGQDEELEEEAGGEEEDRQPVPAHLRRNRHLRVRAKKARRYRGLRGDEGFALVNVF